LHEEPFDKTDDAIMLEQNTL